MKNSIILFLIIAFNCNTFGQDKVSPKDQKDNPSEWIIVRNEDGLVGILNAEGIEILPTIYYAIHPFGEYKENWARIENTDGLNGFINSNGEITIAPKYTDIQKFGLYNKKDWALVSINGLYGFINLEGKEIVEPKYSEIEIMPKE
jgi:hypothetical protein